ncbi:BRCT domain-containing protein [Aspergillus avenaceus]|uniref:BRCT domain-containing protein n=1 Tax=Aspergillus avenaceus TaxID=36643 RepID=A0A5N6U9Z2_ASPAV|nr:BRCT domain-containing protein [Aspergillus avenaceus]
MAEKAVSNKEHPLAGVVLCFTSILPEQRTDLATIASQMGATLKLDLTSDVTHLIVGEINTAKYKFVAQERADVIALRPEWVEAVRQSWMQGEDTDVRALEEQYKFPTFAGLFICITGFEDMAFRNHIQDTAVSNGAEFRKDLTKQVTHLIARDTDSQKYKFATQWNIKVVTVKWFNDSIERGMVLEETLYHPLVPPEQQGAGAWNRSLPAPREKPADNENASNPRPRKLRRIASTKLGDQNEGIWGEIMGIGSRGSQQNESQTPTNRASILQETKSFASETTLSEAQTSRQQQQQQPPSEQPLETSNSRDGFLDGCYFFISGFSSKQISVLRHHLSFNGAQLVGSMSEFSRPDIPKRGHGLYIIVPYKMPREQIPSTEDLAFECEVVTDMWLERCLDARALVPPESHVSNTPVPRFPIPGFNGLKICSTGVSRIDLLHLSKLVTLIGASYNEYLTPSASVLLCNDATPVNPEKLRHTHEWKIPTVTVTWLWDSIRNAQKQPLEAYKIRKPLTQDLNHSRPDPKPRSQDLEHPKPTHQSPTKNTKSPTPIQNTPPKHAPKHSPEKQQQQQQQQHASPEKPPSTLESTLTSFLKQARTANSRSASDLDTTTTTTTNNTERPRSRRRKPLLGRAPSHTSIRSIDQQQQLNPFSRASSIDTLNEDGCGSAIESVNNDSLPSLLHSGKFEFDPIPENQSPPPMTQLNYEDPDAVAMREKFLARAGKPVEKRKDPVEIGEVKELESVGWGSGRRTRNAGKVAVEDGF